MKKIIFIILISISFLSTDRIFAQGCGGDAPSDEGAHLFGFIQPQYEYSFYDEPDNTFKFKRARLGIKGNIPYDFSYYTVMEMSPFVSKTGSPYLLDAFISYTRFKWARISMGSFKQPFGMEVNTACNGLHTIERANVSDQLVTPQRDYGLMILGGSDTTLFKYSVAIMNGSGLDIKDNNASKDFIGRIIAQPLDFLSIGGSFRYGHPLTKEKSRLTAAAEVQLKTEKFLFQAEYIYDEGDWNRAAGGGCGSDPVTLGNIREGAYVMALYKINDYLQPVVKFEYFDKDKFEDNDMEYIGTIGINYFFNDWTRLQINYRHKMEENMTLPNDEFKLQLQVKF